jgi:hypothetical protein
VSPISSDHPSQLRRPHLAYRTLLMRALILGKSRAEQAPNECTYFAPVVPSAFRRSVPVRSLAVSKAILKSVVFQGIDGGRYWD